MFPTFDNDLGILFLAGKGDGLIRTMEFTGGTLHYLQADFMSNVPGKVKFLFFQTKRVILSYRNIHWTLILMKCNVC